METRTLRGMELAILKVLSKINKEHKMNLIGRPYQRGSLESSLDTTFDPETRELADRAFEALKAKSLIRPTYGNLISPELWVEITSSGREALEREALDPLDSALLKISPHLVELGQALGKLYRLVEPILYGRPPIQAVNL